MVHLKAKLSFPEAKSLLGLQESFTPDELKKAYRDASKKAHPDMGGSTSDMQKVNEAYEILQGAGNGVGGRPTTDWASMDQKYRTLGAMISKDLAGKFMPENFVNYLNTFSEKKFEYKILRVFPTPEIRNPSFAGFSVEFFTPERDEVFSLEFSTYLSNVVGNGTSLGGGADDLSYNIGITCYAYLNNRKQKIAIRDWNSTNRHTVLTNPENVWPKARLKKLFAGGGKVVYKKADMLHFLKNKLGAKVYGDFMGITLPDDSIMMVERWLFKARASWSISEIYNNVNGSPRGVKLRFGKGVYFSEDEESALKLLKAVKTIKSAEDAEKMLHVEFPAIN